MLLVAHAGCFLLLLGSAIAFTGPARPDGAQDRPALLVNRSQSSYELSKATLYEVVLEQRELATRGLAPRTLGETRWHLRFERGASSGYAKCGDGLARVVLSLVQILPSAKNLQSTNKEEIDAWNTFMTNLKRHEERHDSIVVTTAANVLDALSRSPVSRSEAECVRILTAEISERNAVYDSVTGNGRSEGAVVVLPRPPRR